MQPRGTITKIILLFIAGMLGAAWLASDRLNSEEAGSAMSGGKKGGSKRNRVVFQDRANNCGAAALKMILEHFGRTVSLDELERRLVLSSGGTSLQRLKEVAGEFGLYAEGWRLSQEDMARVRFPVVIFLRRSHFVVADSLELSGSLLVRDPAVGKIRFAAVELKNIWDGEVLVFKCGQAAGVDAKNIVERE